MLWLPEHDAALREIAPAEKYDSFAIARRLGFSASKIRREMARLRINPDAWKNPHRQWGDKDLEELVALAKAGGYAEDIAEALKRSISSVKKRADELGYKIATRNGIAIPNPGIHKRSAGSIEEETPVQRPTETAVLLMEKKSLQCCFPLWGSTDTTTKWFCGKAVRSPTDSYCPEHCNLCYNPPPVRIPRVRSDVR